MTKNIINGGKFEKKQSSRKLADESLKKSPRKKISMDFKTQKQILEQILKYVSSMTIVEIQKLKQILQKSSITSIEIKKLEQIIQKSSITST